MNQEQLENLRKVVDLWKAQTQYSYEYKQLNACQNPFVANEGILYFANALYGFFCDGKNIEIYLASEPFLTGTLSDNPLSDNLNGDIHRLKQHLQDFDKQFYQFVQDRISDCIETLTTSDPLFF